MKFTKLPLYDRKTFIEEQTHIIKHVYTPTYVKA